MTKFYSKTKYLLLVLNCSVIPLLITGPFLSDLAVSLSCILFLFICTKENKWSNFNNDFFKIFFVFYLYYLVRSIVADDPIKIFTKHIFYIRHGIFVISTIWLIKNFYNYKLYFTRVAIITFLLLCMDATFQFFSGTNILGMKSIYEGRISGLFGNEYILGSYITRLTPLILGLLFFYFKERKGIILCIFCFFYLTVLVSGERTSFVLINVFLVYFFIFIKDFQKQKIFLTILLLVFSFLLFNYNNQLKGRVIHHTIQQLEINTNNNHINVFSKVHEDHIMVAIRMFKDNIYFGKGPDRYQEVCLNEKFYTVQSGVDTPLCPTHPHHFYFQILAETGLVGLAFILILIYRISLIILAEIKSKLRDNKNGLDNYQILLIGCLVINLFPLAPSGNVFNNWLSIVYFLPIGFILNSLKTKHDK